jgi:hypothetical protein
MNTLEFEQLSKGIEQSIAGFQNQHDVNQLLIDIRTALIGFVEERIVSTVQQHLSDPHFLATLKALAGKSALRFNGYKPTSIRLLSGQSFTIDSPYFAKAPTKVRRGRKSNKRKSKSGCHLGLAYLGFIDRCSGMLTSSAVQAALLCPSFEIAKRTLLTFGIEMNIKTIKRLCMSMGEQTIENRHRLMVSNADRVENRIMMVCIDGGRLRERRAKRGRRPIGSKRQGYHTDWREPTQLVIQWLDDNGRKCKDIAPIYDATMADTDAAFDLLAAHLRQLECDQADMVIFCADGAKRYWRRFSKLAEELDLKAYLEIIDYTHAKQNLEEILDKLPKNMTAENLKAIREHWKNLLWQGDIAELGVEIRLHIKSRKKREQALTKYKNYFRDNYRRMQYAPFRHLGIPTGSGCVESAIRRVINLRLKSPGIFWKRKTAETMLFLRSALLCGRWKIMLNNLLALNRGELIGCH